MKVHSGSLDFLKWNEEKNTNRFVLGKGDHLGKLAVMTVEKQPPGECSLDWPSLCMFRNYVVSQNRLALW